MKKYHRLARLRQLVFELTHVVQGGRQLFFQRNVRRRVDRLVAGRAQLRLPLPGDDRGRDRDHGQDHDENVLDRMHERAGKWVRGQAGDPP